MVDVQWHILKNMQRRIIWEDKFHAEEANFTNSFKNKAVQLDPFTSIVNSSHTGNTYSKKQYYGIILIIKKVHKIDHSESIVIN